MLCEAVPACVGLIAQQSLLGKVYQHQAGFSLSCMGHAQAVALLTTDNQVHLKSVSAVCNALARFTDAQSPAYIGTKAEPEHVPRQ